MEDDNQLDQLFTIQEVAQALKVDPESVRRYVRDGKLKSIKLGGKYIRISKTDLEAFIESLRSKGDKNG